MADDNGTANSYDGVLYTAVWQTVHQYIGLLRQDVFKAASTTGLKKLEAITPRSNRPSEYPGIRPYYTMAARLKGLEVRTNWQITPIRVDSNDNSTSFVMAEVTNPHPGAHVMMFGARGGYEQKAHIPGPQKEWPRKTSRRMYVGRDRPVMMTNWQTLAGEQHWFHHNPYTHGAISPRPGFAVAVMNVMESLVNDSAKITAGEAQSFIHTGPIDWIPGLTIKVTG